eukprot:CAMPEP_0195098328 /NCGR_PEP_ID=MMETSP0448-20130528/57285_1 /TAXON_ID=66468 /ORGANISM="Heterocapsa triquestra, Strain CCMP 448" /LENGTH=36 /DNA_ID= /DNA_START= /DNA_END= /DNA_ORIENTATION=
MRNDFAWLLSAGMFGDAPWKPASEPGSGRALLSDMA